MAVKPTNGLLEDMFDPETVERMKDAEAEDAFQLVDTIKPEYRCPRCSYAWRGSPMPPVGTAADEDTDG